MADFRAFDKIARLSRECVITEKIDGTNAQIFIGEDDEFLTGSRTRWITPGDDNFGFSRWAHDHKDELLLLGPGCHFGEWWGAGIQRKYGLEEKRFSLFNTGRWGFDFDPVLGDVTPPPPCCHIVPVLATGIFSSMLVEGTIEMLRADGSQASLGFMKPEGVVIYHAAARSYFKKTLEKDTEWKGKGT